MVRLRTAYVHSRIEWKTAHFRQLYCLFQDEALSWTFTPFLETFWYWGAWPGWVCSFLMYLNSRWGKKVASLELLDCSPSVVKIRLWARFIMSKLSMVVLVFLMVFLVQQAVHGNPARSEPQQPPGRQVRGFRPAALSTARGFGKRGHQDELNEVLFKE